MLRPTLRGLPICCELVEVEYAYVRALDTNEALFAQMGQHTVHRLARRAREASQVVLGQVQIDADNAAVGNAVARGQPQQLPHHALRGRHIG